MAEKIPMLALSPTMEEGVIVKWLKSQGQSISQGEVICEVETDKAVMEFESPCEGILLKIVVEAEQKASIGQTIAIVGRENEDVSSLLSELQEKAEAFGFGFSPFGQPEPDVRQKDSDEVVIGPPPYEGGAGSKTSIHHVKKQRRNLW